MNIETIKKIIIPLGFDVEDRHETELVYVYEPENTTRRLELQLFTSLTKDTGEPLKERGNAFRLVFFDTEKQRPVGRTNKVPFGNDWNPLLRNQIDRYITILEKDALKKCPRCGDYMRYITSPDGSFWGCNGHDKETNTGCRYVESLYNRETDDKPRRTSKFKKASNTREKVKKTRV